MKFVIFHGSLGSPDENWFPSLKAKLEYMGQDVICPRFPIDSEEEMKKSQRETIQNLDSWMAIFEKEVLPQLLGNEPITFIGHSLGNLFILHVIEKFKIQLDCAIFVSPMLDRIPDIDWKYDKVNSTFYKTDFNFEELQKYIPVSYVLYSDTDPYIEPHRALHFAKVMNSSHIMVRSAGHMNAAVNLHEFPLVYDLCVTRLDLDLYQKYSYKREVEDIITILRQESKKYFEATPEELDDEGTFHFMNLKKGGFATLISNSEDWDPEDEYFEGGRNSARNGLDMTRVFIIVKPEDLQRNVLKKQIQLDMAAGIKVYTIPYEELKEINCEEDFGIWDNEYVCIQNRDENGVRTGGIIDARVKSLLTAQNWRDRILRKSKELAEDDIN